MLNVAVAKPILKQPGVAAFHGQRMPAGVAQRVRMRVGDAGAIGDGLQQLREPVACEVFFLQTRADNLALAPGAEPPGPVCFLRYAFVVKCVPDGHRKAPSGEGLECPKQC